MSSPATPVCTRCGEPITPGARFCMKCGSDVSGEQGGVPTAMLPAAQEQDATEAVLELLKKATIGEYEILRELGRGGMATVYLAHDIALDRKVALKVMSPALLLMGEGMTERFKREARTAASLSHPNIIPIYTVKSAGKTLFFVMKFIPGRSLESLIKDIGPMPVPMVRDILQQVGSALGYAHRNGIVHRDVKPANIMIDEEGWTFVTDFGIAKVAENRGLTMTGIAVGTPSYMSPEQCAAKDITGKSDQYSLGVVAYEMLTGRQPFDGDSAMAIMFAHFHEAPRPLAALRPECPGDIAETVMRMLEKAPDRRWPSIEEALGAMGAQPLAHDDPVRLDLVAAVRAKSNRAILDNVTPPPTSPVPPPKGRTISDAATTPIPTPRVVGIAVTPESGTLHPGETLQLAATLRAAGGTAAIGAVAWTSADPAVAAVSPSGLVTAAAPGTVTITARAEGVSGAARVTVAPAPVSRVRVEPAAPLLEVGGGVTLTAFLLDAKDNELTGRPVSWSVAPAGVVALGAAGEVTALKPGRAEVVAVSEGVRGATTVEVKPAPVAAVSLTPPERSVTVGDSAAFTAVPADVRGQPLADRPVSWSSSAPRVVAVSPRGIVTGLAEGRAEIIARVEGKEARAQVRVTPAPVAVLAIAQPEPLLAGTHATLQVTLKDSRGNLLTGREVKWSSSTPAIATVTPAGELTAVAPGTARIAAQVEGRSGTVAVTVLPVPAPVAPPVAASPPPAAPPVAATEVIAPPAPVVSPRRTVPVTAEHPARPPSRGRGRLIAALGVAALLVGAAVVFLRPKPSGEIPPAPPPPVVTAPGPVASITITGDEGPLAAGRTRQLAAALKDAAGTDLNDRRVTWSSSDPSVAEVSANGAVTGRQAGTATITALSEGQRDEFGVVVEAATPDAPPPVATLALSGGGGPLEVGGTVQLAAAPKDAKGAALPDRQVVWSSGDPKVAQVSATGLVSATGPGQAVITASSEGKSAELRVTVNRPAPPPPAPVASVVLTPADPSVTAGQTLQLSAVTLDAGRQPLAGRTVSWKSGDEAVARVGSDGLVTAVSKGTATITATAEGKSASTRVTVNEATVPVAAVTLTPAARSLKVGESTTWDATARDPRGRELADRTISWSSSAPQVAAVNGNGQITGVAAGAAEIRATAEGKTASLSLTVTAPPPPTPAPPAITPGSGPAPVSTATTAGANLPRRAVAAGSSLACGLTASVAVCWGAGFEGVTPVSGTAGLSGLTVGRSHACGLASGGRAVCWGDNRSGQLGDGSTTSATSATPVATDLSFTVLSAGASHTCGLAGGKAYCWGRGHEGQLGEGSSSDRKKPVPVRGGKTFVGLSAGGNHTCAITAQGQAYCWGDGFSGQLGYGAQDEQHEPIDVSGDARFVRITAGGLHSCGLTSAGKAWCWGSNDNGQLGDGSKNDRTSPVAVQGGLVFEELSAGTGHTCGRTASGEAYCWGENKYGQLGDGSKNSRDHPVAVSGGQAFSSISAGEGVTCGLLRAGGPVCWGRNDKGQVGDGTTTLQPVPTAVRP